MTEDEAKTKWCPFVRVGFAPEGVNGCNRPFEHPYQQCIASACMAWRWSEAKRTAAYLAAVQAHMKATGENFNKATQTVFAERGHEFEHTEGFCGLAGGTLNP